MSQAIAAAVVVLVWRIRSSNTPTSKSNKKHFSLVDTAVSAFQAFGPALYLFSFFCWIMATSDRYIIDHFRTTKEVGIYAINYGLWSIPYLSLSAWLEVTRTRVFERAEIQDWPGVRRILRNRLMLTCALAILITAVIYLFGKKLASLVIGEAYWHSRALMLIICTAHWFYVMGIAFQNAFTSAKRAATMVKIVFCMSLLNVLLNIILVPRFGIIGAAWSTLVAYVLMCFLMLGFGVRLLNELEIFAARQAALTPLTR
jgi:O-antigen/teichoic acid export membrane protein